MFEVEKDDERIYMHGQKDQQIDILNDRVKGIGRQWPRDNRSEGIGNAARGVRNSRMSNRNMDVNLRRCR